MKMTTEEAFVKVLQMHGIEHAFGIIGSAMMPISDLFPAAGITFWDVAHETNGGLICDGYTRATGKMGMAIAQNGPGVTGTDKCYNIRPPGLPGMWRSTRRALRAGRRDHLFGHFGHSPRARPRRPVRGAGIATDYSKAADCDSSWRRNAALIAARFDSLIRPLRFSSVPSRSIASIR